MGFVKGQAKVGGRRSGTPNKLTTTFRQAVLTTFENLGGIDGLTDWAAENPTEFYKIAARLIPGELKVPDHERTIIVVNRSGAMNQSQPINAEPAIPLDMPSPNALREGKN